jgi:hypothetical protein
MAQESTPDQLLQARFDDLCKRISRGQCRVLKHERGLRDAHYEVHRLLMEKDALIRVRTI